VTNEQWKNVTLSIANLFPTMAERMTPEQTRAWRSALDACEPERVQTALLRWYRTNTAGEWPVLARIVAEARPLVVAGPSGREAWKPCPADVVKAECERGRRMLAERRKQREAAGAKP
jgi:hypothetical protein